MKLIILSHQTKQTWYIVVHQSSSIHVLDSESPRLPCHVMGQLCHGLKCPGGGRKLRPTMVQPMAIYMPKNNKFSKTLWLMGEELNE